MENSHFRVEYLKTFVFNVSVGLWLVDKHFICFKFKMSCYELDHLKHF